MRKTSPTPIGATHRISNIRIRRERMRSVPQLVSCDSTISLSIYQPTNAVIKSPPRGIMNFAVRKSNQSNTPIPRKVISFHGPNDMAHAAPKSEQTTVTSPAALLRAIPYFSDTKAVHSSCIDMLLVRAASSKSR